MRRLVYVHAVLPGGNEITVGLSLARRMLRQARARLDVCTRSLGVDVADAGPELDDARAQLDAWQAALHAAGYCRRCGRPLTDPESVALGLGPDCARRIPRKDPVQ